MKAFLILDCFLIYCHFELALFWRMPKLRNSVFNSNLPIWLHDQTQKNHVIILQYLQGFATGVAAQTSHTSAVWWVTLTYAINIY